MRQGGRHHANQIGSTLSPMGRSGHQKRQEKGNPKRKVYVVPCRCAQESKAAKSGKRKQEHNKGNHFSEYLRQSPALSVTSRFRHLSYG